ncbi:hypothetical protein [Staphylococcus aureus]
MKLNELEKDSKAKEGAKALSRIKRIGKDYGVQIAYVRDESLEDLI